MNSYGRIIGYNNDSGILYKKGCGTTQYRPKRNLIPKIGHMSANYSNITNESTILKQANADGNVDFYRGKRKAIRLNELLQPRPPPPNEPKSGGSNQDKLINKSKKKVKK